MVKNVDNVKRESYSVRLNHALVNKLKHIAIDERKTTSQLVEEGIMLLLDKYDKKN